MEPMLTCVGALNLALALLLGYVAWRHDPTDRPLAWLRGYVVVAEWCMMGLTALHQHLGPGHPVIRSAVSWPVDVLFVSWFAGHWAVASRYHKDRWPPGLGLRAIGLAAGLGVVAAVHHVQRRYLGLGPEEIGLRWVVLHGACLGSSVMAGYHLAQVLRTRDVVQAHLVMIFSVGISILQFLVALLPGAWRMDLYHTGVLAFLVLSLGIYAVRLVRLLWRK